MLTHAELLTFSLDTLADGYIGCYVWLIDHNYCMYNMVLQMMGLNDRYYRGTHIHDTCSLVMLKLK